MADKFTTEEVLGMLVWLAELCGVSVNWTDDGEVRRLDTREVWHPHTSASQRDEAVEALMKDDWEVIQSASFGDSPPYECELNHAGYQRRRQSQLGQGDTPGDAFVRAVRHMVPPPPDILHVD